MMSDKEMNDCWQNLANAIIVQAARDYVKAKRVLLNSDYEPKRLLAESVVADCKRFFASTYFEMLSPVDAEWLLERLDEKANKLK